MRYLIFMASVLVLAGCAIDPKEREARETAHLRELARVCEKIGYPAGSDKTRNASSSCWLQKWLRRLW